MKLTFMKKLSEYFVRETLASFQFEIFFYFLSTVELLEGKIRTY